MDRERIWDQIHTARYIQTFTKKKVRRPININKQEEKSKEFKEKVLKQIVKENKDKEIFLTNQDLD